MKTPCTQMHGVPLTRGEICSYKSVFEKKKGHIVHIFDMLYNVILCIPFYDIHYSSKWKQFINCMFVCSMYGFFIKNKAHVFFILIIYIIIITHLISRENSKYPSLKKIRKLFFKQLSLFSKYDHIFK